MDLKEITTTVQTSPSAPAQASVVTAGQPIYATASPTTPQEQVSWSSRSPDWNNVADLDGVAPGVAGSYVHVPEAAPPGPRFKDDWDLRSTTPFAYVDIFILLVKFAGSLYQCII